MPPLTKAIGQNGYNGVTEGETHLYTANDNDDSQIESLPPCALDNDTVGPTTKTKMETIEEEDFACGNDLNDSGDSSEDVVLFVEYKYCTICHIEQPLRTKHCK